MKKIIVVLLSMFMVLSLTACSDEDTGETGESGNADTEKIVVGFSTDTGGLGDQAYNDAVYKGIQDVCAELDCEVKVVESRELGDYENNLRALFNDGVEIMVVAGAGFADAVNVIAQDYPDNKILVFDASVEERDNVMETLYREQEAAYLLGAFAGLVTKTNTVGYIGGIESPLQERARCGFEAGFYSTNPEGTVLSVYTGSYSDVGKGKETASTLYSQGADYIATWAGACNLGVFQAATDAGEGNYALGAALGQFENNPEKIIASQVKTIDRSVYTGLKSTIEGGFTAGKFASGIKESGVDMLFNPNTELVNTVASPEVLTQVEEIRNAIINGEISIPTNANELATFKQ